VSLRRSRERLEMGFLCGSIYLIFVLGFCLFFGGIFDTFVYLFFEACRNPYIQVGYVYTARKGSTIGDHLGDFRRT